MAIAVITGASSGMGRVFVSQVAKNYPMLEEIWVVARRMDKLCELQKDIDIPVRCFALDLLDEDSFGVYEDALRESGKRIKMLVNSAGFGKVGSNEEIPVEEQLGMIDLNCRALTAVTAISLPYMTERGHIVMLASSAAFVPQINFGIYAATKAYVLSYASSLREELRSYGITVTAVCPGPVSTEFFQVANSHSESFGFKKHFFVEAEDVVALAMKDAVKGKGISVYGTSMRMFRILTKVVPHSWILRVMSMMNR